MKIHHCLFLLPFLIASCKKSGDTITPRPNQPGASIAYYTFDGDAKDHSLNPSHDGIIHNFNGNAYIQIPNDPTFSFKTKKLTIAAWIKPTATDGTYVIQKESNSGGGGPFSLDIYPGTARGIIYDINNKLIQLNGSTAIKASIWQHIALTWDGQNANLYYNGQLEDTTPFTTAISTSTGDIYIGAYKWAFPQASFIGTVDNVRIYDTYLTSTEIKNLYNTSQ
jgi:hypothetical protein